ncbi:hypothetical protein N7494_007975 [Penicillium frequentans]|uniref:Uncharacterized protein n=1 Tax=Penicillium frequentans TaxID=3151616 RepID=A0AAD6GF94_9EURO|nr:hypothetical protein N7494_007975 [Penicillium glabrum]
MPEETDLFHDESWGEPWRSSEFPPEETPQERRQRFNKKPGWSNGWNDWVPRFFRTQAGSSKSWPWGYVIYRTTFTETSDQDWAAAIEILDRYCSTSIDRWKDLQKFEFQPNICEVVHEGYRNVIVQDSSLEGASADVIRKRHIQWDKERGFFVGCGTPRVDYCIALDARCIRSILASTEPDKPGMVGYVNVIDCTFEYDPTDPDNECSEHYDGSVRVCLNWLFMFALSCASHDTGEQTWGDWGMERPGWAIYTDGHCSVVEKEEVFLCSSHYNLFFASCYRDYPKEESLTESQYNEHVQSITKDRQTD